MAIPPDCALVDANVFVYAVSTGSPHHQACRRLVDRAQAGVIAVCVAPQVVFEFYATMTNPRVVTPPLSPDEAAEDADAIAQMFPMIFPPADIVTRVAPIARRAKLIRQDIFDGVLAATMLANGISRIYTVNARHFHRIGGITVLTP